MTESIDISDGRKRRTVTFLTAVCIQLARKAMSGDTNATRLLLDQATRLNLLADNEDDNRGTAPLTDQDAQILAEMERTMRAAVKGK